MPKHRGREKRETKYEVFAEPTLARVIKDPRDSSKDYFIPVADALRKFNAGTLAQDATNSKPGERVYVEV